VIDFVEGPVMCVLSVLMTHAYNERKDLHMKLVFTSMIIHLELPINCTKLV